MTQQESDHYYRTNAPLSAYMTDGGQQKPRYGNARHAAPTQAWPDYYPPYPKRKRRVFLWVFLAIQALFIIWIVAGSFSHPAGPTAAQQAAQQCANGGWHYIFKSYADCTKHYGVALNDASNTGKALGVGLIVVFWVVVDFLVGITYLIYRLTTRR